MFQVMRLLVLMIRSNRGKSRAVDKGGLLVLVCTQFKPTTHTGMRANTSVAFSLATSFKGKVAKHGQKEES